MAPAPVVEYAVLFENVELEISKMTTDALVVEDPLIVIAPKLVSMFLNVLPWIVRGFPPSAEIAPPEVKLLSSDALRVEGSFFAVCSKVESEMVAAAEVSWTWLPPVAEENVHPLRVSVPADSSTDKLLPTGAELSSKVELETEIWVLLVP